MPSSGQALDVSHSDKTSFEREVTKLMESNVTLAMQYLQSKGLCLMPIALASAISSGRESSSSPCSENWKTKNVFADGLVHNENNSPGNSLTGSGIYHKSSSNGETVIDKLNRDSNMISKCNGAAVKPQEINYSYCTARESKPKI